MTDMPQDENPTTASPEAQPSAPQTPWWKTRIASAFAGAVIANVIWSGGAALLRDKPKNDNISQSSPESLKHKYLEGEQDKTIEYAAFPPARTPNDAAKLKEFQNFLDHGNPDELMQKLQNLPKDYINPALVYAAQNGNVPMMTALITKAGADANTSGALLKTVERGRDKAAKYLLSIGTDFRQAHYFEDNVFNYAVESGHFEVAQEILDRLHLDKVEAEIIDRDKEYLRDQLIHAMDYKQTLAVEFILAHVRSHMPDPRYASQSFLNERVMLSALNSNTRIMEMLTDPALGKHMYQGITPRVLAAAAQRVTESYRGPDYSGAAKLLLKGVAANTLLCECRSVFPELRAEAN